ncbi:dTDP-4-dehydrorhamnose reductase [Pediococcus damnosus]|uniref:dTDP-4-dehydrorhamnose reductase n=1 Tax=Pediococcus damnosus TaxID=51663 RepID=A0A143AF34_9LACO|nr:dTDP-4-dehydrorhamnose reductase [Pediococcus damnosus]AMV62379.1 dTDP-4-dehydrorhamnose reductase [Pediococcus damnosus]AMV67761.1 dTDP-4-dehydrorhamnose reductase [Pediococcus damnosus]KJU73439.1 dTDP-4-dehydrorhamnose reductase [Pediococcus damnosus LMG 28219]PIO86023.1 NAD(P)-dependent oxidoreductase [Pediococcus damnosus]PJE50065.1 dTDP-4-dehydrorhamnose reductase [Pediococcus damnosus]
MNNILITGANGQLGMELRTLLDEKGIIYTATGSKELDITDAKMVSDYFGLHKPDLVFHCAAYTAVDAAEEEPGKSADEMVNVAGTQNVATAAESVGTTVVYISTDYVFDGQNTGMYKEMDQQNPQSEYGRTKNLGEKAIRETMSKYYIIRTSWVFGKYGKNFVYTMLNLAKTHDVITVVDDQVGRPTWTRTLAEFMLYAVENKVPYGVYNLSNDNQASWFEFATEILKNTTTQVKPVTSAEYSQKATRPAHSVLSLEKTKATGFKIPTWQEALQQMMVIIDK